MPVCGKMSALSIPLDPGKGILSTSMKTIGRRFLRQTSQPGMLLTLKAQAEITAEMMRRDDHGSCAYELDTTVKFIAVRNFQWPLLAMSAWFTNGL
jgi:hypothetical protein